MKTTEDHLAPTNIRLPKAIAALQIQDSEIGERLGVIAQLPKGAELHLSGRGLTPRTRRVEVSGRFYYVFLQDLEEVSGSSFSQTAD